CFGVRDALALLDTVESPRDVTIHGDLVHNPTVLVQLDVRGFQRAAEHDRQAVPVTPAVMITAHGVSDRERQRLLAAGKSLIDTTCPLVERAHQAAQKLRAEGRHVLVIGRRGHVEVRGIVEDLVSYDIVEQLADVQTYPYPKLGVMCQTTTPPREVERIRAEIITRNPHASVRLIDTVCQPTRDRQLALQRLVERVDAVVVVGGRNSNNTRQLVELCREGGVPAHHVQSAADVQAEWFTPDQAIGLTAGTSTLDSTIDEVEEALRSLEVQPYPMACNERQS
ncbi:MAG TPA: 4-hydroxy-3-methylbut-2-enyl diphosphate reductase, partial [Planctomycetaceae bacterium]|nr:4-hydroxy-3-methylbut-2-enyl diphosphate reductase [Planctomycetaceae bacterium]